MKVYIVTESSLNGETVLYVCADKSKANELSEEYNETVDLDCPNPCLANYAFIAEYEVIE